jgi:hypothetical protein
MAKISGLVWAEFSHEQLVSWQFSMGKSDRLLGMLLLLREKTVEAKKTLLLTNCRGVVKQVLDVANFGKLFTIR